MNERTRKLCSLLGLARRAGKLAVGMRAVERLARGGERPLVVMATDAGDGMRSSVAHWTDLRGVLDDAVSGAELADIVGREKLAIVAVADPGFVRGIEKLGTTTGPQERPVTKVTGKKPGPPGGGGP